MVAPLLSFQGRSLSASLLTLFLLPVHQSFLSAIVYYQNGYVVCMSVCVSTLVHLQYPKGTVARILAQLSCMKTSEINVSTMKFWMKPVKCQQMKFWMKTVKCQQMKFWTKPVKCQHSEVLDETSEMSAQ